MSLALIALLAVLPGSDPLPRTLADSEAATEECSTRQITIGERQVAEIGILESQAGHRRRGVETGYGGGSGEHGAHVSTVRVTSAPENIAPSTAQTLKSLSKHNAPLNTAARQSA